MNQTPRKRYTPEFKAQAVELLETGKPVTQVAEERRFLSKSFSAILGADQERTMRMAIDAYAPAPKETNPR